MKNTDYRELLLGCGRARDKRLVVSSSPGGTKWVNLTTLDCNPDVKPDICLNIDTYGAVEWADKIGDDIFNEVHAYEVLEHLGRQGDIVSFFGTFWNIWRVLKPDGFLIATVPSRYSEWLWGDPGHTRAILPSSLVFLDQSQYSEQCDGKTPTTMSDYRNVWKGDFKRCRSEDDRTFHKFILQAVKPARIAVRSI